MQPVYFKTFKVFIEEVQTNCGKEVYSGSEGKG